MELYHARTAIRNVDRHRAQSRQYATWRDGVAQGLAEQYGLTCEQTGLDYAALYRQGLGVSDAVARGAMHNLALALALDYADILA